MMFVLHEPLRNRQKCKVELHIHIDGAIRPETIWEIMRKKKMDLPGDGSLRCLKKTLQIEEPQNLNHFLNKFNIFLPAFKGDLEAVERLSLEFVEDQAARDVVYCEARLAPHIFLPDPSDCERVVNGGGNEDGVNGTAITSDEVVEAVLRGLKTGEERHGTKVRLILCCLRGLNVCPKDVLRLCEEYRNKGVVGIDVAGNPGGSSEKEMNAVCAEVFEAAKAKGIRRTVHAGEDSGWESVRDAINELSAERIGHGYRVVENEDFYQKCLEDGVHFEMCPYSSYFTGAIKSLELPSKRHPILRLAEDGGSFSINNDDPTVLGRDINDDYALLRSWGFNEANFTRANFEAAKHCFLPPNEKEELIAYLKTAYGIPETAQTRSSPQINSAPLPERKSITSAANKPAIKIASWEERTF